MKPCILCNSVNFITLYKGIDWGVLKCAKCEFIKGERSVKVGYGQYHRDEDYKKFEPLFRNIFQKRVNLTDRYINKPGRVLEIGCSTGVMLGLYKEKGWEGFGVEPSGSAKIARKRGVKVLQSTFEKAKLPTNYFDLVVANHTLEHMDNPVEVLKKIYEVTKKGGVVLIDVPNFASLGSKILGSKWPFLLPLEHNFQFTRDSLSKIFKKCGFGVVYFESRSGIFDMADPATEVWQSLVTLKKRFFTNLLTLPYSLLATLLNQGDAMSMIGKKM